LPQSPPSMPLTCPPLASIDLSAAVGDKLEPY